MSSKHEMTTRKTIVRFTCVFFQFLKDFLLRFRFWNVSDKEASVRNRNVHFEHFSGLNFVPVELKS